MTIQTGAILPPINIPFIDESGRLNIIWYRLLLSLYNRTGAAVGVNSTETSISSTAAQNAAEAAQSAANTANNAATAAHTIANTGVTNALSAQTTANSALALAATLNTTAVLKTNFQYDGVAPLASPSFSGVISLPSLVNAANDAAAASAGVQIDELYRNGSAVMQRIS